MFRRCEVWHWHACKHTDLVSRTVMRISCRPTGHIIACCGIQKFIWCNTTLLESFIRGLTAAKFHTVVSFCCVMDKILCKVQGLTSGVFRIWQRGGHGERMEREPITGVWGQSPQRGPGAEPLVGGLKLKHFLLLNVQWKPQIRPFFNIWKRKRPSNIVEFSNSCWKMAKNAPFYIKSPVKNFHGRAKGGASHRAPLNTPQGLTILNPMRPCKSHRPTKCLYQVRLCVRMAVCSDWYRSGVSGVCHRRMLVGRRRRGV